MVTSRAWTVRSRGGRLFAAFVGELDTESGRASAREFALHLAAAPAPVDVVFELAAMTGFEANALRAWQETLLPLRRKIRSLETRGARPMVRMGASGLALFLQITIAHR